MRLSGGENRILTPVAPPPDGPRARAIRFFTMCLPAPSSNGVINTSGPPNARRPMREPRNSVSGPSTKRRSRRASANRGGCLDRCLIAASTLLVAVGVLGYFIFTTAGELSQLQTAFSRSDERVKQLLAQAADAQKAVVGYYEEAQRLAQQAVARAAAGDVSGAKDLNTRAANCVRNRQRPPPPRFPRSTRRFKRSRSLGRHSRES